MSQSSLCLNCNRVVSEKFCPNCGQKTDTHRITFKHFIFHDILHGIWHFEKGILFSLKEAIRRPGKAALDYISGKRIRYYNVFYLILLMIGLNIFMNNFHDKLSHIYLNTTESAANEVGKSLGDFLTDYSKLIIFSFVPLFAVNSFLIYKRKKLNISEHFIIAGMVFLGVMIIVTASTLIFFIDFIEHMDFVSEFINLMTPVSILLFILISYYKTFRNCYSRTQTLFKSIFFLFLLLVELILLLLFLVGYFTDWTFHLK
ncbi:DUF3667 domain-containing protein [Flavobacterium sp.]|uniref:DUF3667 domain-containing protein n=1 Tax=Flavobacterium sp. TaxID=239 RepID=UPI00248A0EF7|nr:DUF3667 domain-containing protein [Flavobacterium sp.]MDI1315709.1 DUF3667 domain-containing protein [Flavobacterium sp.]